MSQPGDQNYGCCVYYVYLLYAAFQNSPILFPLHGHDSVTLTFCPKSPVNACSSLYKVINQQFLTIGSCLFLLAATLVLWFGFNRQ